jgi:hypothetical protein
MEGLSGRKHLIFRDKFVPADCALLGPARHSAANQQRVSRCGLLLTRMQGQLRIF